MLVGENNYLQVCYRCECLLMGTQFSGHSLGSVSYVVIFLNFSGHFHPDTVVSFSELQHFLGLIFFNVTLTIDK